MRAVERAADARREAPAVLKFISDEVGRGEGVEQEVREQEAHEMLPAPRVLAEIFGELTADDLGPEGAQPHQAARVKALHTIGDLIFVQLLRRALGERAVVANAICTVIDATRSDITLQIPANAQPNTDLTIQGGEMAEPVAIPYMNTGHQIFDFNDWPGSGGFTHSSQFPDNTLNFLCDGTEGDGYPEPLNEGMKYLRFHGNVGAWGWMVLWAGYIQVPAEVAADPAAYNLCFEVCTNASYPLNSTTRIALGNFMWMPGASGIPVNTYGGWRTMRIGLDEVSENTILPDGCSPAPDNTEWKIVFTPTDAMDFDLSMCNFRFSKKIG